MGLLSAIYGYYDSQWRKAGLPLNISESISERISNNNATAGANTVNGTNVPAGEIWVITQVSAHNNTSTSTSIAIRVDTGTTFAALTSLLNPIAGHRATGSSFYVLFPGWHIDAVFNGCTAGDDLFIDYSGYKINILD